MSTDPQSLASAPGQRQEPDAPSAAPRGRAQRRDGAPYTLLGPPSARDSSPGLYLLDGGRPAAPTDFWPLEVPACSSLATSRDFFRDKTWLSQSSSTFSSGAPIWEGGLALAEGSGHSGGGGDWTPREEEGSPAGAECRPGAECWLSGRGTKGVESAEPPLRGSLVGEGGSRSSSSSLRPNQSALPFLGWVGLVVAGVLCLELGSPLRSKPPSAKNLLQDREEGVQAGQAACPKSPRSVLPSAAGVTARPTPRRLGCPEAQRSQPEALRTRRLHQVRRQRGGS